MIAQNHTAMSLPEFQALRQQLLRAGYFYTDKSIEASGESYSSKCCGSHQVMTVTLYVRSSRTLVDYRTDETGHYAGFHFAGDWRYRLPLLDSRSFDICLECWHVSESLPECDGGPDDN